VSCAGASGIDPAEVLFERESVCGDSEEGGQAGPQIARAVTASTGGASGKGQQLTFVSADGTPLNPLGAIAFQARGFYQFLRQEIGVRRLTPRECERLQGFPDDFTLVDWPKARRPKDVEEMTAYYLASGWPKDLARELAKTPDGHRYKALGNSMAVPVMQWLGARIRKALCYESTKAKQKGGQINGLRRNK
jgi:site-specific DNA-cytosine methylase